MPAVVLTDPRIAWPAEQKKKFNAKAWRWRFDSFPWKSSGRAAVLAGRQDGLTKMIIDRRSRRVLGVGIVGRHAEDLIAEAVLAIEMGALADDITLSIRPHPTLSETQAEAAAIFLGSATHMISRSGSCRRNSITSLFACFLI